MGAHSFKWAPLPPEDAFVLEQYELHYLVLVHHVDGDVARFGLRPEQRGAEHDGHALSGHAVGLSVVNHPGGQEKQNKRGFRDGRCPNKVRVYLFGNPLLLGFI